MGRILQFRCTNKDCPSSFSLAALSDKMTLALEQAGIFSKPNTGQCSVCGKPCAVDYLLRNGTERQKTEHNQGIENLAKELRGTSRLLQHILGKRARGK